MLERIGAIEQRRAAGAVGGQQAVAEIIGRGGGIDFGEASAQALAQADQIVGGLIPGLEDIKDAIEAKADEIIEGLDSLGVIIKNPTLFARTFLGTGNTGND